MTTKILIKPTESKIVEHYVHEEHESDMIDFLKNHNSKKEITTSTQGKEGVNWFTIELTSDDVEEIKTTAWYSNCKWDNPQLDDEIIEGADIEVINIEYVPKKGE